MPAPVVQDVVERPGRARERPRRHLRPLLLAAAVLAPLGVLLADRGAQDPTPAPAEPVRAAGTYRVSPDGEAGADFADLEEALRALRPGDTLLVEDGTYEERIDVHVRPGTAQEPVRVRAAPGARPVVEGLLWLTGADYWHLSGVDVTWAKRNRDDEHMVKFHGGRGWSFTDAEVSKARSYAALLVTGGARDFRLADLYVHDTRRTNGENQDHLIYVNTYGYGAVIERCLLVGSRNGRGIKIGPPDGADHRVGGLVVRYNTLVDNTGPSNVQLSYTAYDVDIHHNILVSPAKGTTGVTSFRLEGDGNTVRQNLWFDASGAVTEERGRLEDGGGNVRADPDFVDPEAGDFRTRAPVASEYGRYATGS